MVMLGVVAMLGMVVGKVGAEECDNPGSLTDLGVISGCISKYNGILEAISKANTTNRTELARFNSQITNLKSQIIKLETQVEKLEKEVFDREVAVGVKQVLLSAKVRRDYVNKKQPTMLMALFSADSAAGFFKDLQLRQFLARRDQETIRTISDEIRILNDQTTSLKSQKINIESLKTRVDKQAKFLAGEVAKADSYVSDLGGKISALSARQKSLLAERTGTYATTVGDVPLADDPAARPDYNPGFSPAFAVFSFGAPHFRGMSQYGALGRAKSGQNYRQILEAYYGNVEIKRMPLPANISTTVGSLSFEGKYLLGIAEMPTVWADQGGYDALKAQAVAARSYAAAYGTTICVTEACQVYSGSKANNPGRWGSAVTDTAGEVVVSRTTGRIISAWYASTSGGYQESYTTAGHTTPGFWDTTSEWTRWAEGAWEVRGGSPWFYKGWYKSRSGKTCGRSHPWLREEEMADMVNAAIVVEGGGDTSGIYPEDARTCWGEGGTIWSKDRLREEAGKNGGGVTSVSGVRVEHGNNGRTSRVVFATNRGEVVISGANFYRAFNLRAPGALALKSQLFNVEKK